MVTSCIRDISYQSDLAVYIGDYPFIEQVP
jgi:hypothetical protein